MSVQPLAQVPPAPPHQSLGETLNARQRWLLLGSLMVSLFIGALDQTVVSTATPRILADLGGFEQLSWLFTSYMLASTVVIPLVGKLGDVFGRKLFLIGGVALFMVSSAACGAAPTMTSLIWFRVVQGLGGGMIFASVFASLGDIFSPAERGKYIGLFTGTFSLASIIGPTVGGLLTDHGGWRLVFLLNIPVGLVAIPAIWLNLPKRVITRKPKIDFLGAILLSAASVAMLLALVWAGDKYAWGSAEILGLLGASAVFVALFIAQEARHPEPILPLHLFKNRVFLVSNLIVFTFGVGVFGAFQYLGIFVQTALGASATASGVVTTPQSVGVLLASVIGGQVIARIGKYKWQTVIGAAIIAFSMVFLRMVDVDTPIWHISVIMIVLGIGFGLVLPTMSLVVQNAVPYEYLGVASSSSQFFRQMGSVLGIAVFGAVLANVYHTEFADRFDATDRAAVGQVISVELDDPTITLNKGVYASIQKSVRALEGGDQILVRAKAAQSESVAVAVRMIFTMALGAALLCLLFALLIKELPLRRTVQTSQPPGRAQGDLDPPLREPDPAVAH
ncbi:MAG: MDR family MFS transporter [Anaerolineaceae bacterium]